MPIAIHSAIGGENITCWMDCHRVTEFFDLFPDHGGVEDVLALQQPTIKADNHRIAIRGEGDLIGGVGVWQCLPAIEFIKGCDLPAIP